MPYPKVMHIETAYGVGLPINSESAGGSSPNIVLAVRKARNRRNSAQFDVLFA